MQDKNVRVRFAPSPTGPVHIGNIRTALFNWLFARHNGGKFLLRIEDTDKERCTEEAKETLLDCMKWLGLDFDEEIYYQSQHEQEHLEVAQKLIAEKKAYKHQKGDGGEVILFRIPWETSGCIKEVGQEEWALHPEAELKISYAGISFAQISKKGKQIPLEASLGGFRNLKVYNADNVEIFSIEEKIDSILNGENVNLADAAKMTFTRRTASFTDLVKGTLSKPLDGMKDLVLVKSNGSPLFHLANICDDIAQKMTHIIRGDDHVENTYRHVLIYEALNETPATYAHLPMIVNQQGKPYSKRDGDAFVGEFRTAGYRPEAVFNYLTLLGWSPGDDREKISKEESAELFYIEKVKSTAAQFDTNKLYFLNGLYMEEMPAEEFQNAALVELQKYDWFKADESYFPTVCALMKSRTKLITHVDAWIYFFTENYPAAEEKLIRKFIDKEGIKPALALAAKKIADSATDASSIEAAIHAATEEIGLGQGKLNQSLRIAITGTSQGAGIYETIQIIGIEKAVERIQKIIG